MMSVSYTVSTFLDRVSGKYLDILIQTENVCSDIEIDMKMCEDELY